MGSRPCWTEGPKAKLSRLSRAGRVEATVTSARLSLPLRPLPVTSVLSFLPLGEMAPFPGLHLTRSPGTGSPAGPAHSATLQTGGCWHAGSGGED